MAKTIPERAGRAQQLPPPWRPGEPNGRGLYEQAGRRSTNQDTFLGLLETAELVEHIVELHNRAVRDGF